MRHHNTCWLSWCEGDCDGRIDPAHIGFTQRFLKDRHIDPKDPRIIRPVCRAHHHKLDNHFIKLNRQQLPQSVERFAREHRLEWKLEKDFGEEVR